MSPLYRQGNKAEGGVVAPRVELHADTHRLNVRPSNSPWLPLHSVEILSIQSMGFKLQLISPRRRCVLQRSSVVPQIFWFLSSGCRVSPDQLQRSAQEGQHLAPRPTISHQHRTGSPTLALVHGQPTATAAHQAEWSSKHPKDETVSQGDPPRFITHRGFSTAILIS